jgi:hypothetical protein
VAIRVVNPFNCIFLSEFSNLTLIKASRKKHQVNKLSRNFVFLVHSEDQMNVN